MSAAARDLLAWLAVNGLGTSGTDLFHGELPNTPDAATALRDVPGFPTQDFMGDGSPSIEYLGVQVACRATTMQAAETRAWQAARALSQLNHVVINGRRYHAILLLQPPFLLGRDDTDITAAGSEGRPVFLFTLQAVRDAA